MKLNEGTRVDLRKHQKAIDGVKVGDTVRIVGTRDTIGTVTAVSGPVDDMDTVYQVTIPGWGTFVYYIDALAPVR